MSNSRHVLVIKSQTPIDPEVGDLLREAGTLGIWEVGPREWRAYFEGRDEDLENSLRDRFPAPASGWITEENVDWVARYQASLRPIPVGERFVILPNPRLENTWTARHPIRLAEGSAFGTGEHFTTASCLRALEGIDPFPESVLDLGCGTGILAVGAALLGAKRVEACDTDPEAVAVAGKTFRINGVSPELKVGGLESEGEQYDCIVANILAETLLELMGSFAARLRSEGRLLLSGILVEKGKSIIDAAENLGFRLEHARSDGSWWTFLFLR
jgi:ribosomal protein L11 methyltransferase